MSGAIATAAIIGGGLSAAGGIAGAAISSNAAGNAASEQANAAENSAQLQYQASQNALNFQEQQYAQNQANIAPWLQSGAGALGNLDYLLGITPPNPQGTMTGGALTPYGGSPAGGFSGPLNGGGASMPMPQAPQAGSGTFSAGTTPRISAPSMPSSSGSPGVPVAGGGSAPSGGAFGGHYAVPMTATGQSGAVGVPGFLSGQNGGPGAQSPVPGIPSQPPSGNINLGSTVNPTLGAFGSLMQPYQGHFTAPTEAQMEANDPGYQARMKLGQQAFEQSAAARGNLLTGGTAQAENQLAQDFASNEYNNYYNQAYNQYASNYNQYEQQQANEYNRLASLAGVGQTAAGQLGTLGTEMSGQVGSDLLGTAQAMGNAYQNAAAANASGMVGSANAWSGALGNMGGNISNLLMMQQLMGGAGGSNPYAGTDATLGGAS